MGLAVGLPASVVATSLVVPQAAAAEPDAALLDAAVAGVPGTQEVITVAAPSFSSTEVQVSAWAKLELGWTRVYGPVPGKVGQQGIGEGKDGVPRTPFGVFRLDLAFGRQDNPGTTLPYTKVTNQHWWDGNVNSPTYDRMVVQAASPGPESENLYDMGPVYDYAVHFDNNPTHTPGKGGAMFLHVTDGNPTLGCVAISREGMIALLKWLSPAYNPVLVTGLAG
ncbi:L,D-transpeptidase family protein [Tsukamurella strandjordii]|uniref:L,D-transpeptidase family protein n=1 Tax=Tsukamurella strandjordii TaxID=147577 RepID=A0AA90N9J3_9ACTN|nr:L,D-transpeptidase family protein [Tsukamurella strandjordii]MDP0398327.1 L,D-transpeptidase family protein [Tsukamurella strandjordii]